MELLKRLRSQEALLRFYAACDSAPVGYLACVQVEGDTPSSYVYTAAVTIWQWKGNNVVVFQSKRRAFDVFRVPRELMKFKTDEAAEGWRIQLDALARPA